MSSGAKTAEPPARDDARADAPAARPVLLATAGVVWGVTTFGHGLGTRVAHEYFAWAQRPGTLHADGGAAGARVADGILTAAFVALALLVLLACVRRFRALPHADRRLRLASWALWAAFVFGLWKVCVTFSTEFAHFVQYGVIAALLAWGLGRGRRPEAAFLLATLLGALDEAWQYWGINLRIDRVLWQYLDWSDLVLNAAGACAGVLVVARGRDEVAETPPGRLVLRASAVAAALLLPLLLLDRVALTRLVGSPPAHPFWFQYEIGKSVHNLTPWEGIPIFVASLVVLGLMVSRSGSVALRGVAAALVALGALAVDAPSRIAGRPVQQPVPRVEARAASGTIVVDGRLDEPDWARAERIGPFALNLFEGQDPPPGVDSDHPPAATHARLLWDERALYVAFECEDADVWARRAARDDTRLPGDEVVEVFLDPDGDEATYYEFEVSPSGVEYDLFNFIPGPPGDFTPSAAFVGLASWDARGLSSAVHVDGTLDVVEEWNPGAPDRDRGFAVEIAIPWDCLRTTTTPGPETVRPLPPEPGDRWRLGLYRVERPRASPLDGRPLERRAAVAFAQLLAWSPTVRGSFHRPERFGVLEFVR